MQRGALTSRRVSDVQMNNSYRIVNERVIRLKRFEFDFANLTEIVKNYLIVQEVLLKLTFMNTETLISNSEVRIYDYFRCLAQIVLGILT
jgi:hypothetical protein